VPKKEHDGEKAENQRGTTTDKFSIEVPRWVVQMLLSGSWSLLVNIVLHFVLYR
jgi:hypothetical protein